MEKGRGQQSPAFLSQSGADAITALVSRIGRKLLDFLTAAQRQKLLEYCHLDTLAMVRILEKMREMV